MRRYFNDFKGTLVLRYWNGAYCRILALVLEVLVFSEEIIHCAMSLINFQLKNWIFYNKYSSWHRWNIISNFAYLVDNSEFFT